MKPRHHRRRGSGEARKNGQKKAGNKKSPTKSSKHSVSKKKQPVASTAETTRQIPPVEERSYVCSKCGYRTDVKDPYWPDPSILVWDSKGKKREECWMLCPGDGGPEVNLLTSPDSRAQRWRYGFEFPGGTIYACTPYVVMDRQPHGRCSVRVVMEAAEIMREIKLMQYLESHGPDKEINLQHLLEAELLTTAPHCYRVKSLWLLSLQRGHIYDDWAQKAFGVVGEVSQRDIVVLVGKLASGLDPRLDIFRPAWSRILHVPIDLSQPIGAQLERINPTLTEIRDYLHRFTTQPPPRDRSEFIWRDIYVFLLSHLKGWSAAQIAEEIFPSEAKTSRDMKIRQILHKVSLAVKKAGIILPPASVKISRPAKTNHPA